MEYRALGNTGLKVSAIGLGTAILGTVSTEYAVRLIQRAVELGVNYFDTARGYWDSEIKLRQALTGPRDSFVISTKTGAATRDDAWKHIEESLERLGMDYVDCCLLHGLGLDDNLATRFGPGGAWEALVEAKEQGLVHHIGASSHRVRSFLKALELVELESILVPMNIANQRPLNALIPVCLERGVGVTIMKPIATGLLPGTLALKWLLNQPIATAVPGATTIEELEENCLVGNRDYSLSADDRAEIGAYQAKLAQVRCRVCEECMPCPQEIRVSYLLGTDVMYDHYRSMGAAGFRAFPWSRAAVERDLEGQRTAIERITSCTRCGECEARCQYGLPIMYMLQEMLPGLRDMVSIYEEFLAH